MDLNPVDTCTLCQPVRRQAGAVCSLQAEPSDPARALRGGGVPAVHGRPP